MPRTDLWTEADDALLRRAYPSVGPLVHGLLGRGRRAAIMRAVRLGIGRRHAGTATQLRCAWCSARAVTAVIDGADIEPACQACAQLPGASAETRAA